MNKFCLIREGTAKIKKTLTFETHDSREVVEDDIDEYIWANNVQSETQVIEWGEFDEELIELPYGLGLTSNELETIKNALVAYCDDQRDWLEEYPEEGKVIDSAWNKINAFAWAEMDLEKDNGN